MFRKYPYKGWLFLSLMLWVGTLYYYHRHSQALLPERMAEAVNKDLKLREDIYEGFILEQDWLSKLYSDSLSDKKMERVNGFPFFMFGYDKDTLKFWNTNIVSAPPPDTVYDRPIVYRNEKGVFIEKIHLLPQLGGSKKLVTLFPIIIYYPLENDYLKTYFVASKYIPVKTAVVLPGREGKGDYPIDLRNHSKTCYLHFNTAEIQKWVPDIWFILMMLGALVTTITWVDLMSVFLARNGKIAIGFLVLLGFIGFLRGYLYVFGLPFNLETLDLFSPQLYASNTYLSSLGDLLTDTLFSLWIVIYVARYTPYEHYFDKITNKTTQRIIAAFSLFAVQGYVFLFTGIIKSLILDSNISFEVSHFYAIDIYTVIGLFVIGTIAGNTCLTIYLFNVQLNKLIPYRGQKYLLSLITAVVLLALSGSISDIFSWVLMLWLITFIAFMDNPNFALETDILKPHIIYWAVFICAFCTGVVQYFNEAREKETRKAYVLQHLTPRRDDELEYSFERTAKSIAQDKSLISFFSKPYQQARKPLNQHFETHYFTGPVNKYQTRFYLFDNTGAPLYNKDTANYIQLMKEQSESIQTGSSYLYYKQSVFNRHFYMAYIPVYNDSEKNLMGYVILDLDLKKDVAETVYPELMQPFSGKNANLDNEYAYAVYDNGKLLTQTNIYPFPVKLDEDTLPVQHYVFRRRNGVEELNYKVSDKRTVVVMHYNSEAIELMTMFSYLFMTIICLAIMIQVYRFLMSYFTPYRGGRNFKKLTIQKRLHYSMLGIVFFSFLVIGIVTAVYFSNESETANNNKLQLATQVAKLSVQDYLKRIQALEDPAMFDSVGRSQAFKNFITTLAANQKIDINIFDDKGNLISTSQEDIYDKSLVSRRMRPEAYHRLHAEGTSIVIQNEKVGDLPYISLYEPLRNEQANSFAYINVPFFSSKKELNYQIYNIIVTFVYIYAFIFLISGLVTVSIAQWITRSFNVIMRQFERINLQLNERIEWPYDDEIGELVKKYNEMVKKVEDNAMIMAQSERESAWREMAKQIAHEIKNPLTPMKLNIQHLQQTIRQNEQSERIKDLTDKVTASIIEQIENLSYIASEFSDFAKMPDAREEKIELNDLLRKAIELYLTDPSIAVNFEPLPVAVYVMCDRSHMLRVFNNLLVNAKQAIPEERAGQIEVSLRIDDGNAIVSIQDNGTGISEAVATKIFQPYFTTKSSGTGLGLAMSRRIIEFWKGKIWFETTEGTGTTFFISLPVRS